MGTAPRRLPKRVINSVTAEAREKPKYDPPPAPPPGTCALVLFCHDHAGRASNTDAAYGCALLAMQGLSGNGPIAEEVLLSRETGAAGVGKRGQ